MTTFLPFETRVLDFVLAGDLPSLGILRLQRRAATVLARHSMFAGVYTALSVPPSAPPTPRSSFKLGGDVWFQLRGTKGPGGVTLVISNGYLSDLATFNFANLVDPWPAEPVFLFLRYIEDDPSGGIEQSLLRFTDKRDLAGLRLVIEPTGAA